MNDFWHMIFCKFEKSISMFPYEEVAVEHVSRPGSCRRRSGKDRADWCFFPGRPPVPLGWSRQRPCLLPVLPGLSRIFPLLLKRKGSAAQIISIIFISATTLQFRHESSIPAQFISSGYSDFPGHSRVSPGVLPVLPGPPRWWILPGWRVECPRRF